MKRQAHDHTWLREQLIAALNIEARSRSLDPTAETCGVRQSGHAMLVPPYYGTRHRLLAAAVAQLPDRHRRWVRFCYVTTPDWDDEKAVTCNAWVQLFPEFKNLREKTQTAIKSLLWACQQNQKTLIVDERQLYTNKRMCELMRIDPAHWSRDWSGRWDRMQKEFAAMDSEALDATLMVYQRLREEHRAQSQSAA
ncbi:bacteriophage antitermination protein Q [Pokkaliibacter sp. CJK22405]|uniref:bacteriophage antitermination protein Q n=1 Tax=Pokkaliibacter sp. CJK22405 TaxID=3384615 RepID=UPI003985139E